MSDVFERLFDEAGEFGEFNEDKLVHFDQTNGLMRTVHKRLADPKHVDRLVDELFTDTDKLVTKEEQEAPRFSVSSGILYDVLRIANVDPFTALTPTAAQAALVLITTYIEEGQKIMEDEARGK